MVDDQDATSLVVASHSVLVCNSGVITIAVGIQSVPTSSRLDPRLGLSHYVGWVVAKEDVGLGAGVLSNHRYPICRLLRLRIFLLEASLRKQPWGMRYALDSLATPISRRSTIAVGEAT